VGRKKKLETPSPGPVGAGGGCVCRKKKGCGGVAGSDMVVKRVAAGGRVGGLRRQKREKERGRRPARVLRKNGEDRLALEQQKKEESSAGRGGGRPFMEV